jgi:hypothetical protein
MRPGLHWPIQPGLAQAAQSGSGSQPECKFGPGAYFTGQPLAVVDSESVRVVGDALAVHLDSTRVTSGWSRSGRPYAGLPCVESTCCPCTTLTLSLSHSHCIYIYIYIYIYLHPFLFPSHPPARPGLSLSDEKTL